MPRMGDSRKTAPIVHSPGLWPGFSDSSRPKAGAMYDGPGLLGSFGLRSFGSDLARLLAVGPVVLALELLDAAGRVHELHLAGEEGVTRRADFDGDVLLGT